MLNGIVGQQLREGKENTSEAQLLKSVNQKMDFIKANPFYGDSVPKALIPKDYVLRYNAKNLWMVELANYWRMLYTIKGYQVEVVCFVLGIVDHRRYDRLFGYRKK